VYLKLLHSLLGNTTSKKSMIFHEQVFTEFDMLCGSVQNGVSKFFNVVLTFHVLASNHRVTSVQIFDQRALIVEVLVGAQEQS